MNIITEKSINLLRNNYSSIEGLYRDRCINKDGKLIPHFWEPTKVTKDIFSLWGTDDLLVKEEWRIDKLMSRLIAIGLNLEIPVAHYIQSGIKRELPTEDRELTIKLLKSNAADEGGHYKGFKYLQAIYGVDEEDLKEAENITSIWTSHTQEEYPLMVSQLIEVGAFLIELGLMRLFGGKSFSRISYGISNDEIRHIATSRYICRKLGYKPSKPNNKLSKTLDETLDFMLEPLKDIDTKQELGVNANKDFFIKCSKELISTGFSSPLNNLIVFFESFSPFEISNTKMYDRTSYTGDLDTLLESLEV